MATTGTIRGIAESDVTFAVVMIGCVGFLTWYAWYRMRERRATQAEAEARRKARRKEALRVPMHTTQEHELVGPTRAQMFRQIERLEQALVETLAEIAIREEPDPILRSLLDGPMTSNQIEKVYGLTPDARRARMGRLQWVTGQVSASGVSTRDPVYRLSEQITQELEAAG
jgi:hypothetical protein